MAATPPPAIALGPRPAAPEEVLAAVDNAARAVQLAQALAVVESAELHLGPWETSDLGIELASGDVEGARFLYRRIQAQLPVDTVYLSLRNADSPAFFKCARELMAPGVLSPRLGGLLDLLVKKQRVDQAVLCERAYKVLSAASACALLGLDVPELPALCSQRGWVVCPDGFVEPKSQATSAANDADLARATQRLVEQAVFLENEIGTHISNKPARQA